MAAGECVLSVEVGRGRDAPRRCRGARHQSWHTSRRHDVHECMSYVLMLGGGCTDARHQRGTRIVAIIRHNSTQGQGPRPNALIPSSPSPSQRSSSNSHRLTVAVQPFLSHRSSAIIPPSPPHQPLPSSLTVTPHRSPSSPRRLTITVQPFLRHSPAVTTPASHPATIIPPLPPPSPSRRRHRRRYRCHQSMYTYPSATWPVMPSQLPDLQPNWYQLDAGSGSI